MTEIFNAIKNFFVVTIPSFAETHWAVLELSFAVLMLLFFITTIWVAVRKRKMKKRLLADKATLTENLDEKTRAFEAKEAEYNELYTAYDDLCKVNNDINAEKCQYEETIRVLEKKIEENKEIDCGLREQINIALNANKEKTAMLEDLQIANEKYKESLEEVTIRWKETSAAFDEFVNDHSKEIEIRDINEASTKVAYDTKIEELESTITRFEGIVEAYEIEVADLKEENNELKNLEVENAVLLKALRKFKEEDETPIQETLKRFEAKLSDLAAKIAVEETKEVNETTESPKRRELSEIAKKLGIKNFATWTNEELKREIAKRKK